MQGTGGSTAMANSWEQMRNAGAEARARLVAAAAKQWSVDAGAITIEKGVVRHASGKSATFGELAGLRGRSTLTGPAKPKAPDAWRLIGKQCRSVDTVSRPTARPSSPSTSSCRTWLTCVIARPTRFGAKVKSFDPAPALAVPGVKEVFAVPQGVAVLADGFWAARKGREALA